jgi:hypothetical protein
MGVFGEAGESSEEAIEAATERGFLERVAGCFGLDPGDVSADEFIWDVMVYGPADFDVVTRAERLTYEDAAEERECCICGNTIGVVPFPIRWASNIHCGACARERAA